MSKHMLRLDIPTPNLDTFNKSIISVLAFPREPIILFLFCHANQFELSSVVGLGLGGPEAGIKKGPSDDVIIISQP